MYGAATILQNDTVSAVVHTERLFYLLSIDCCRCTAADLSMLFHMCFYTPFYFYFFLFLFVGYALGSLCVITCAITGFYLRASVAFFVPRIRATYITVNIFIIVVRMNANARSFLYKPRCILFAACVYMCAFVASIPYSPTRIYRIRAFSDGGRLCCMSDFV